MQQESRISTGPTSKKSIIALFSVMVFALGFSSISVQADQESSEQPSESEFVELGNLVWYDRDQDGLQDSDEIGIPFVPINLYEVPNMLVSTTLTDADGIFEFTGIPAGNYYLEFGLPNGYQITEQNVGSNDLIDSDADRNGYTSGLVFHVDNESNETIDLGVFWDINTAVFCDGIDFAITDWSNEFELQRFNDPRNGTVVGVDIFSYAGISQDIFVENKDPNPATITVDGTGMVTYALPESNVAAVPLAQTYSQHVSAYDGIVDFAGTSGFTVYDLVTYNSTIRNYAPDGFLGEGKLTIAATAEGSSEISGSGNMAGKAHTSGFSGVCVTYYYANSALAVDMVASSAEGSVNTSPALLAVAVAVVAALMVTTVVTVGGNRRSDN